jgi:hypothetical protein
MNNTQEETFTQQEADVELHLLWESYNCEVIDEEELNFGIKYILERVK